VSAVEISEGAKDRRHHPPKKSIKGRASGSEPPTPEKDEALHLFRKRPLEPTFTAER
jgi:hypothetical protein